MTLIAYLATAALVVSVIVINMQRVRLVAMRDYAARLEGIVDRAKFEAMSAEARSRNVGGTGEHAGVTVTPLSPVSRAWTMARDPRFSIPSDRVR